ncbi:GNAT family N-acetyltransferase [Telluria aromaticivorans]|uniref:GNAT family N-acetyltransferase n=1 Tax=Telluria aromaticivorans TaxID=2725995 RepID=A0A7Y2NYU4_9BURK|nr:GNAT family N-acetyltransferase [Telluria aromaticivorans]NNG21851.1 GNAT family N-acetyltransferase [Telluria aromaticivorans]
MNDFSSVDGFRSRDAGAFQSIVHEPFPDFLHRELEARYESVFCTLARILGPQAADGLATYVAGEGAEPATIVVFRRTKGLITVLNEYFAMSAGELEQMARHLFSALPGVRAISLPSVEAGEGPMSYTTQRFNSSEDIVVSLPTSPEEYLVALGSNTRAAIRRSEKIMEQRYPEIEFAVYERDSGGRELIDRLVELSRQRITNKRQVPSHNDRSVAELVRMVEAYGVVLVASMRGQICGGVICTQVGTHSYMHVVTHESSFDDMRLGMLCCYKSICDAIRRGAREYHLLSGKYDYKFRFLGHQRDYEKIVIYRSLLGVLPNLPTYIQTLVHGKGRWGKQRLTAWRRKWKT